MERTACLLPAMLAAVAGSVFMAAPQPAGAAAGVNIHHGDPNEIPVLEGEVQVGSEGARRHGRQRMVTLPEETQAETRAPALERTSKR